MRPNVGGCHGAMASWLPDLISKPKCLGGAGSSHRAMMLVLTCTSLGLFQGTLVINPWSVLMPMPMPMPSLFSDQDSKSYVRQSSWRRKSLGKGDLYEGALCTYRTLTLSGSVERYCTSLRSLSILARPTWFLAKSCQVLGQRSR